MVRNIKLYIDLLFFCTILSRDLKERIRISLLFVLPLEPFYMITILLKKKNVKVSMHAYAYSCSILHEYCFIWWHKEPITQKFAGAIFRV